MVGGRTPYRQLMTGGFRGRTNPDRLIDRLLLREQSTLLCRPSVVTQAARLTSSAIVHVALLASSVTSLNRLGGAPVGVRRTVLEKTQGFSPPLCRELRHRKS